MKSIVPYINEVKSLLKLKTYPQTMEYLGMAKQGWTKIQKGGGVSEKNAMRIAQVLGIEPLEIMAISMALKAENNEIRDYWLKIAKEKENQRLKEIKEESKAKA
jgi:peptidyl-tRNA hydrolase